MRAKNKHPATKAECLFLPLEEQHGQDEERTHEADRGGSPDSHLVEAMGVEPMSEKSSGQVSAGAGDLQHSRRATPIVRLAHW